jgi:glycosyltransferase involved in cell wall biosynthesis
MRGAFCTFESLHQLLPVCDEVLIMDLGSTDGTLEALQDIANYNPKVKVLQGEFSYTDAGVFASLANELITLCSNDRVLYWQSDEIWHEDLVQLMRQRFDNGDFDLSFWRIQYRDNFQKVKWFPHLVHRVGIRGSDLNEGKNNFEFVGDGMNTTRSWDAKICSNYGGEYFPKWGDMGQDGIKPYVNEMITDISLVGGFRDNIPDRRRMHAPFWHEEPTIEGIQETHWYATALSNEDWTKPESPYNLPNVLRWHVGRVKYELRQDLLEALYVL